MNRKIRMPRHICLAICLMFVLSAVAVSQNNSSNGVGKVENEKFYELTKMAPNALANGESEKAKIYAETLLKQAESFRENWNYGNAVHVANLVLGHIALDSGDIDQAKNFLLEAGKTPGSPQLNSFGPNMLLAKELLEKEEYETVSQYLELVGVFWKNHDEDLNVWKESVKNKEIPNFRANLIYRLEDLYKVRTKKNK